jgi:hypothetical protein
MLNTRSPLADHADGKADADPHLPAPGDHVKGASEIDSVRAGKQPLTSLLLGLAAVVGTLLLFAQFFHFAWYDARCARAILAYPFGIDYGEGIVWQQALLIPGPRMYGPIDRLPFIVFHYPPVYHLASRAVMAFGVDPLSAGRMVSIAATAVTVISIAWLVAKGLEGRVSRPAAAIGAAAGALLPLSLGPLEIWFDLMRVDMLAVALAFLGVVLTVRAEKQPAWLLLAMPAFVLSVYTKQTELAAPASALAALLVTRPRAAILAGLCAVVLGVAALALLEWLTADGFLRHILSYNVNTWSFDLLITRLRFQASYGVVLVAAAVGLGASWLDQRAQSRRPKRAGTPSYAGTPSHTVVVPIAILWLLLSLAVLAATVGKTGSNVNYFVEPMCVCAVGFGLLVGRCWHEVVGSPGRREMALRFGLVVLVLAVGGVIAKRRPLCTLDGVSPALVATQEKLVREIASQDRPVLSEDMVLSLRAGKDVPIEMAIFSELAATGQWDQRRLLNLIDARAFAFVVTTPNEVYTPQRYTPEMLAAIERAYPRTQARGPYVVRYPAGP